VGTLNWLCANVAYGLILEFSTGAPDLLKAVHKTRTAWAARLLLADVADSFFAESSSGERWSSDVWSERSCGRWARAGR